MNFVLASANLKANIYGIKGEKLIDFRLFLLMMPNI